MKQDFSNPDSKPPLGQAAALGLQHVLAMFASNVTPAFIVGGAAGLVIGDTIFLVQMSILFAGVATLIQTIGVWRIGARLPIVQGTSFAFIPVMIGIAKTSGIAAVLGGALIAGIFHFFLGFVIGKIRHLFPPLVTGLVIITIGLALIKVGVQYAAGGVPLEGKPGFGSLTNWSLALTVIIVTLGVKFFSKGFLSSAAILIGLVAGYLLAIPLGLVEFSKIGNAEWFAWPKPFRFGFTVNAVAVIGMCSMAVISAIETVGDISGITQGGANREATDKEIEGGTLADGLGSAVAAIFGGLPNTSFSQNVGIVAMTGVMSRYVVTLGAIFLVIAGLIPKVGAVVSSMPTSVLGGGVIMMFGMIISAGLKMLFLVKMNQRNMVILAVSLSIGLGLQAVPSALQGLHSTLQTLLATGLLPVALLAIILNLVVPDSD